MKHLLLLFAFFVPNLACAGVIGWPDVIGVEDACTQVAMDTAIELAGYTRSDVHTDKVDVEFFEVNFNGTTMDTYEYVLRVGEKYMSIVVDVVDQFGSNRRCVFDAANSRF